MTRHRVIAVNETHGILIWSWSSLPAYQWRKSSKAVCVGIDESADRLQTGLRPGGAPPSGRSIAISSRQYLLESGKDRVKITISTGHDRGRCHVTLTAGQRNTSVMPGANRPRAPSTTAVTFSWQRSLCMCTGRAHPGETTWPFSARLRRPAATDPGPESDLHAMARGRYRAAPVQDRAALSDGRRVADAFARAKWQL